MADPFLLDDGDDRLQLPRKPRYYDEAEEPPVDHALLEWAKREKTIIAEHAVAAKRVVR